MFIPSMQQHFSIVLFSLYIAANKEYFTKGQIFRHMDSSILSATLPEVIFKIYYFLNSYARKKSSVFSIFILRNYIFMYLVEKLTSINKNVRP